MSAGAAWCDRSELLESRAGAATELPPEWLLIVAGGRSSVRNGSRGTPHER